MGARGRERKGRRRGGGREKEGGGGEGEERKREGIESKLLLYVAKKSILLTKTHALFQTPEEFLQNYTTLLEMERYRSQNLSEFIISGSEFDATWAMALGLQTASERVRRNDSRGCDHLPGRLVPLEELDYMNQRMGCVLMDSFQHVTFSGVTVSSCH